MKHIHYSIALIAALVLHGPAHAAAFDDGGTGRERILLAAADGRPLSRDAAVALVQKQTGGRVLAVERSQLDGRETFRIKLLTRDGEVRVVHVDVATGAIK
jgi:uncharacterized membrane protein YkoI